MEITKLFNSPKWDLTPAFFDNLIYRNSRRFQNFQPLTVPGTNIEETDSEYILDIAIPGINKDDIHIELINGSLKVFGESKSSSEGEDKKYKRKEFSFSSFERVFYLPENVTGEIDATYDNGILKISIPKKEMTVSESKRIEIK